MDEDPFRGGFRTSLTNEEMLVELRAKAEEQERVRLAAVVTAPSSNSFEAEFFQKFQEAAYTPEELEQVITLVWALDEKHPTLWTCMARKLIITMMRDRMAR